MDMFLTIYSTTALVVTVLVFCLSKRFSDRARPASIRLELSVAAGLLWPLVIIGLIQFGSFVAYTKVADDPELEIDVHA